MKRLAFLWSALALLTGVFVIPGIATGLGPNAIRGLGGCDTFELARNDDGSTGSVQTGFPINFFGQGYDSLFVNNNGNVTFDNDLSTFTPFPLLGANEVIIAPFFADVDTRNPLSGVVTYGTGTDNGVDYFCVDWNGVGVGYYSQQVDKLNNFQLILWNRSDTGMGNFDIEFNFDRVQWETGDASDGEGGLGGNSARSGFANGIDTFLELPGSAVNGAFLDANEQTGLIHNSQGSQQPGRYVFRVRNGQAPTGGTIDGFVFDFNPVPDRMPVAGSPVQACAMPGGPCFTRRSNSTGFFSFAGLAPGTYEVQARAPSASTVIPSELVEVQIVALELHSVELALGREPGSPPPGTVVNNASLGVVPTVVIGQPFLITHIPCVEATSDTATVTFRGASGGVHTETFGPSPTGPSFLQGRPEIPFVGLALATLSVPGCPDLHFNIYIDPSGFVRTVGGAGIEGATVSLYRSDSGAPGSFDVVPDGDAIMSPSNRTNPDTTDATGHFGWDVIAGFYKVRAENAGCHAPGNPAQAFVETAILTIPPPVFDLDLRLECASSDGTPPVATASQLPVANAAGWNRSDVNVTLGAVDESGGTGVASITYAINGGPATTVDSASVVVPISGEGIWAISYMATDGAGNPSTAAVHTVRIDSTAPEFVYRYDAAGNRLGVFGRDQLSGVSSAPFEPVDTLRIDWTSGLASPIGDANRRTFVIRDLADNTTTLVDTLKLMGSGRESKVRVEHFEYDAAASIVRHVPPVNQFDLETSSEGGVVNRVEQEIQFGDGTLRRRVEADWKLKLGTTEVTIKKPEPEQTFIRPGFVPIELESRNGLLHLELPA